MVKSNAAGSLTKFKILLWKDIKIQKKVELGSLLIFLLISCAWVIFLRHVDPYDEHDEIRYSPCDINTLPTKIASLNLEVLYAPQNDIFEGIVSDAVQSLKIPGFKSFKNAVDLEKALMKDDYLVGIHFLNDIQSYPKRFAFELRFPAMIRGKEMLNWHTEKLEPNLIDDAYIKQGFVQIQHALVLSYIKRNGKNDNLPKLIMKRFPEAAGIKNEFEYVAFIVFTFATFGTIISVNTSEERQSQIKEIMILNGLHNWLHWLAWFVQSLLLLVLMAIVIVILMKVEIKGLLVLVKSSPTALLFLIIITCLPVICVSFVIPFFVKEEFEIELVHVIINILGLIIVYFIESYSLSLASCVLPYNPLALSIKYISMLEAHGIGLQWSDFYKIYDAHMISPVICFMFVIVDCIIYMLLCLYFEQLNPGEYGVRKKWNFPFQSSYWTNSRRRSTGGSSQNQNERREVSVAAQVQNLTKIFGQYAAVNDLSFDIRYNEITVLLGKNGAGKSTFILTLTGLLEPTSGTALVNGYDIRYELSDARKYLSLCPQNNAIFDNLSVKDHIKFFCQTRGIKDSKIIEAETNKYLEIMELTHKSKTVGKKLSGGMKRKLNLCCALVGCHSKVVLCDEPSAGVDPAARRRLWALLLAEKKGKAIVLTTHFMDEAEALADRIVIIKDGRAKFDGTIFDMKKNFGQGYRLVCDMRSDCVPEEVTEFLKRHIDGIFLDNVQGNLLNYRLPAGDESKYGSLFRNLENNMDRLRLTGFGVSISTVEDVFTQIVTQRERVSSLKSNPFINAWRNFNVFSEKLLLHKKNRKLQRLKGLLVKWKLVNQRKWYYLLLRILFPALIVLGCSLIMINLEKLEELPALLIDIKQYDKGEIVLETPKAENSDLAKAYEAYSESFDKSFTIDHQNFENYILDYIAKNPEYQSTKNILVGGTIKSGEVTVWVNLIPMHVAPLTLNFMHNAMARTYVDPGAVVEVTNAPLPIKDQSGVSIFILINCLLITLLYSLLIFPITPLKEKINGIKHQQLLSGLSIYTYWLTYLVLDFIILWLTLLLLLLVYTYVLEFGFASFTPHLILWTFFAIAVLLFLYILSVFFGSVTGFITVAPIILFGSFFLGFIPLNPPLKFYVYPLFLVPPASFVFGIKNLHQNNVLRDYCETLEKKHGYSCPIIPNCCEIKSYLSCESPGIGIELIGLLLSIILFAILLFIFESSLWSCIIDFIVSVFNHLLEERSRSTSQRDDDVNAEHKFVKHLSEDERDKIPLIVNSISKEFCGICAVRKISFSVKNSDCFGLLGVNGAGKTTTFKMLTAEEWITTGNVHLYGQSLKTLLKRPTLKIGYCPQKNVLFDDLTCQENLRIYCLLRGVRATHIWRLTNVICLKLDFIEYMHKRAKVLSGGNKRKLCLAIALLGNPKIIYLDEPSSGMDPIVQRHMWSFMAELRETGKPLIITSHNMEECESLCTRLAIMVKGEFKCLGTAQHLKNKFSKNFILKINIKKIKDEDDEGADKGAPVRLGVTKEKIIKFVAEQFPTANLTDEYGHLLIFQMPMEGSKWSEIFETMEANRKKLFIDDYTISQATLDDIFVEFSETYNN